MNNNFIRWIFFYFFVLIILIFPLAPINFIPSIIPLPDLLLCFLYAYCIKNPKKNHYFLIIFLSLLADFLWMRAPGLWSLLTLIFIQISSKIFFQKNARSIYFETILFLITMSIMVFLQNIILFLTISTLPTLQLSITYLLLTVVFYPLMSIFLKIFEIKKTII